MFRIARVAVGLVALIILAGCSGPSPETAAATRVAPSAETQPETVELIKPVLQPSCSTVGSVLDLEVFDNTVVFAGDFEAVVDAAGVQHERAGLAACTLDGEFKSAFGNPTNGEVRVVMHDGERLLIGGKFTLVDHPGENFAAIDPATGAVEPGFGPDELPGSVHGISPGSNGRIYVSGAFNRFAGLNRTSVVRVSAAGDLDEEFFPRLGRTNDDAAARIVYTVVEFGDRVYIGGDFGSLNEEPVQGIGAVDVETGRINALFNPDISDPNPLDGRVQIREVIATDDWIYLCGDWWTTEGRGDKEAQRNFGRFTRTGTADASVEPSTDGGIRDCELVAESWIALAGHFDTVSTNPYRKLALVSLEAGEVTRVLGADSTKGIQAIDIVGGQMFIGGTFNRIAGDDQPGFGTIQFAEPIAG